MLANAEDVRPIIRNLYWTVQEEEAEEEDITPEQTVDKTAPKKDGAPLALHYDREFQGPQHYEATLDMEQLGHQFTAVHPKPSVWQWLFIILLALIIFML